MRITFCRNILLSGAIYVLLIFSRSANANLTYNVIPVITPASSSIVGGTIVTDGSIGAITAANIVSSSITISHSGGLTELTTFNILGSIQASPTALFLPHSYENEFNRYFTSQSAPLVNYANSRTSIGSSIFPDGTIQPAVINIQPPGGGAVIVMRPGPINLVIAGREIPEPGTILLLGLGIGLMLIVRENRVL
mgnify:CR=1 FL=1